jgi:hypothetical protein
MRTSALLKPVAIAALVVAAGSSQAALSVFNTLASFQAAVGLSGTDTFAGFSISGVTPSPINRSAGAFTYSATATPGGFYGGGTFADPFLSTNRAGDSIVITPQAGIAGIAGNIFGSDISGAFAAGPITYAVLDSLGGTATGTVNATSITANSFFGFVSDGTIVSITLTGFDTGTSALWPSIDNLSLAAPIPEPGTYALMLGGLGLVGFLARRRRKA